MDIVVPTALPQLLDGAGHQVVSCRERSSESFPAYGELRVMDEVKQKRANVSLALILGAIALGIFGMFFWTVVGGVH